MAIRTVVIMILLLGPALSGCAKSPPIPPPGETRQAGPSLGPAHQGTDAAPPLDTVPHPAPPAMTDADLIAFLKAANATEVEQARLAQAKATHPTVKEYGDRMAQEHESLRQEGDRLATALNLRPEFSPSSRHLLAEHAAAMETLKHKAGGGFDAAYLEHNIRLHQKIMEKVEQAGQEPRHPDVQGLLDRIRPALKDHLRTAQNLQRSLLAGRLDYHEIIP